MLLACYWIYLEDGDLPEEPAPVGVPSLSVEAAPVVSEPDKERALADELLLQQVASPQKAATLTKGPTDRATYYPYKNFENFAFHILNMQ